MKLPRLPDLASLSRRERVLAAGSVLVLAAVVLDRAVLAPWLAHMNKMHQEIRRLEEDVRNYQGLLARKLQIMAEAKAFQDYVSPVGAKEPDMGALLREIESLGRESGIALGEVKPLEGSSNELYQEYDIEVRYQGSLQQWIRFVYLLQTSKALFTINRSSVSRTEGDPAILQGSLRLTGKVIRKPPAPASADRHGLAEDRPA